MPISDEEEDVIISSKTSLLFHEGLPWGKKSGTKFDVAQGSYDGAECAELVGLFILNRVSKITGLDAGLYRDDGLAVTSSAPRRVEAIKKEISKIFSEYGLAITTEANIRVVDFLDVVFDLETDSYRPYTKPNNIPQYVHKLSNHPPSVLKNIPESVNKRLSTVSSNEEMFNTAVDQYQEALYRSGYEYKLQYDPTAGQSPTKKKKRNRQRNITWFNPPYNASVRTKVIGEFFKLVDKCFPVGHELRKIFNRNTLKASYSTTPNMGQIIAGKNVKLLKDNTDLEKACNCGKKECPLDGMCLVPGIVYQAVIEDKTGETHSYVGMTKPNFKSRLAIHNKSYRDPTYCQTALSRNYRELEAKGLEPKVTYRLIDRGRPYSPVTGVCQLCIREKYYIMHHPSLAQLNKRSELFNDCIHKPYALLFPPRKKKPPGN